VSLNYETHEAGGKHVAASEKPCCRVANIAEIKITQLVKIGRLAPLLDQLDQVNLPTLFGTPKLVYFPEEGSIGKVDPTRLLVR